MKFRRFLLWCLLSVLSGLGKCEFCSSPDNENVLQINNAYTYHFRSVALAQAVGTTEDHSKMVFNCDVRISHDEACFHIMELQNCVLTASGGELGSETPWIDQQPLPDLSKYHVMFSLINGEIKVLKTHEDDPLQYVNIKRGILSAFVFKMSQTEKQMTEIHTDIHGACPLTSEPDKEADGSVKTSKDMLYCHYPSRNDWQFSPWSLFWNMSFIQHLINSTTDCDYTVSMAERRIEKVHCKERHAIMLESTRRTTTAVQTNINYYLEFVKSEIQTSKPRFPTLTRKSDIRFEYDYTPMPESNPVNFLPVAEKMLSDIVQDSLDEIRLFTIPQFTDFVGWLRTADDLTLLVEGVKSCSFLQDGKTCDQSIKDLAFSYLSDALVQCNTLPCAKALTYMVKNDLLSPTYLNFVYRAWSYMHYSKPGFITNFMDICKIKNSHQCWLSLGTFVHRTYSRYSDINDKVLQEMKDVADHIHSRIEECEGEDDVGNEQYTDCLIHLKAASNMGKHFTKLIPDGISRILDQATNDNAPIFVRTSALEAIKEMAEAEDEQQSRSIYDQLLPVLKNTSLAPSVRILTYDQLLLVSEGYYFEEHLLNILMHERNVEVKFYVANSLNSLFTDVHFKAKREKFLNSLKELLLENGLSLETIIYETKGKSRSFSRERFLNMPFVPDYMKQIGVKIAESAIYDANIYPAIFNRESTLQFFNTLLPVTKLGTYFEGMEDIFLDLQKKLAQMNSNAASFSEIYEAVMETLKEYGPDEEGGSLELNIDENVAKNIKELHKIYWQHHKKLNPYAKASLDVLGSTLKYIIQDSFQPTSLHKEWAKQARNLFSDLEDRMKYRTTRVIRIIEAYHQVPTMMGLPLNWTTNATLAFSIKAGLNFESTDKSQTYKGSFHPSVALTFLNRMVLDFPLVTQIGVQANSSGYTSTDLRAQYTSSKGKKILRIERPSRTQKILELFRTNQLIKHDDYVDISDWDIERTTSSWCTNGNINSAAGLKFCLSKSYPNVTHRIKPWALMAGWCKWQFLMHPVHENSVFYHVELQQTPKQKSTEFAVKFSVTDNGKERAADIKVTMDNKGKSIELKTSLLPDFGASLTRSDITKNKKVLGHKIEGFLKIMKDIRYQMVYSNEGKIQKSQDSSSDPNDENSHTLVNEESLSLTTPFAIYKWNKEILRIGENTKIDVAFDYENLNSKSNWMRMILPSSFWEDDKRASMKIFLNWKKPIDLSQDTLSRHTFFQLAVPSTVVTLTGDSHEMNNRRKISVILEKTNPTQGNLDTFINFAYHFWKNENTEQNDKEINLFNITIPRRSWSLKYQKSREAMKYQHELQLKRILMKAKSEEKDDYVGWWSDEVGDHFRLEEQEIKLVADTELLSPEKEELLNRYTSLSNDDIKDLGSSVLVSKVVVNYPFYGRIESIVFDGYFIMSRGPTTFRFQKDFDLTSSYNNLILTSHSVYRAEADSTTLDHSSYFTHTTSQTKAYNTIQYSRIEPEGQCRRLSFKHDIRSHVFDLSTDATHECSKKDDNLYTLVLKLNTNSSKWGMLDLNLNQIVQDISSDYTLEDMTANHPAGTIHVDAEWHGKTGQTDHWKRVVWCSKSGRCPNAELFLEFFHDGRSHAKFSVPSQNASQITYDRRMSPDCKTLHVSMGFSNKESVLSKFFDFTGEIIAENYQVWKGTVNVDTFAKVKKLVLSGYESMRNTIIDVAKDKYHPLNEILQPALKMTLYDYWQGMKAQVEEYFSTAWFEIRELFLALEMVLEPAYTLLTNSITGVNQLFRLAYDAVKDKSVIIWAINYFEVPHYLRQSIARFHGGLSNIVYQFVPQEGSFLHFKFITGKLLSLESFREWPSVSFHSSELSDIIYQKSQEMLRVHQWTGREKIAMIFGPLHVYTFDGHLYDIPKYPHEDCSFLLAHDVHKSLFTVFASKKSISILFPEMSITIDDQNEVFINGSRKSSSLPIQAINGKVTVKRGSVVEVWSPSLSIVCSSRDFLCVLKLNEFHIGGIIGLLGNADEYIDNEYMFPNGKISSSLLDYVKRYEISGKPECKNIALSSTTSASVEEVSVCTEHFADVCSSHTYIREQFLEACASDIKAGHGPCYATAALSALCHFKNMASHTKCNIEKQETDKIGPNLEVMLIVQESKYLTSPEHSNAPLKGIEGIVRAIDSKFMEDGYDNIKYSLVGFGGNGVHYAPTVHSVQKDVWLPSDAMMKDLLKTLEFKSKEEADGVEALKFALQELGYDSFVSKVAIVITVKDREVTDKATIDFIRRHLEDNGITLYVLSSYPSIEKGKKVYGVRADGLIFSSQSKDEAYLDYPRGNLAKLASSTRGSLFLSKFLVEGKPSSFFTEIAQEIWAKINKEKQKCRSCKTVRGTLWWFRNECSIVPC